MTNVEIGKRIAERRDELGLTVDYIAQEIGVNKSTISRYERGSINKINLVVIGAIARVLGLNPSWIVGKSSDRLAQPEQTYSQDVQEVADAYSSLNTTAEKNIIRRALCLNAIGEPEIEQIQNKIIPLFGTAAAAGPGEMDTGLPWEDYSVPADSPANFAVRISGDSMEPILLDGQIALCAEKTPHIGDVGVFMVNGSLLVKQFIADNYGNVYLRSLNRKRKDADMDIKASGNDTVTCYGTVILKHRPPLVDD